MEHRDKIPSSPPNRPNHKRLFWTHLVVSTEMRPDACSFFCTSNTFSRAIKISKSIWRSHFWMTILHIPQSVHHPLVIGPNSWWSQSAAKCGCRIPIYPIWTPITPTNAMLCWLVLDNFIKTVPFCRQDELQRKAEKVKKVKKKSFYFLLRFLVIIIILMKCFQTI